MKIISKITNTLFGKKEVKAIVHEIKEKRVSLDQKIENMLKEVDFKKNEDNQHGHKL